MIHIAYRALTATESVMPISLLELRAVLFAVKRWGHLIFGAPVTVVADHRALQWILDLKDPSSALNLYALELIPNNLLIQYRPPGENWQPD
jgi:hypothetical protein